jgi:arylsulfatase A-like enzyme
LKQPNIVFVIIDSLRYDRLGSSGYRPAVTPTIDRMIAAGTSCSRHFSVGCPTQVAFPGIWTSTLPLDHGGYTDGIHTRPHMLSELLRESGYNTYGITTGHPCSSHYGYGRGFETFIDLIDMHQWFRSNYIAAISDWMARWKSGDLSDAELADLITEKYGAVLSDTLRYLDTLDGIGAPQRSVSRQAWRDKTLREQRLLARDPIIIANKFSILNGTYDVALGEAEVSNSLLRSVDRAKRLDKALNRRLFLRSRRDAYGAREVNRLVAGFFQQRQLDKPYFLYAHFFDLHEYKLLIPNMTLRRAARLPGDVLATSRSRPAGGGRFHDLALRDVDRQFASLLSHVEHHGDPENTIVVVTGDHGTHAGLPNRPHGHDLERMFYDNFTHIPLVIHGPQVPRRRIDRMVSHLDVAPTILELAGCDIPAEMRGTSVFDESAPEREHVLAETGGNGRCEVLEKPLFFSVRSETLKCIFVAKDRSLRENEVYDLLDDPGEQRDLASSGLFEPERLRLRSIAMARLNEIRANVAPTSAT